MSKGSAAAGILLVAAFILPACIPPAPTASSTPTPTPQDTNRGVVRGISNATEIVLATGVAVTAAVTGAAFTSPANIYYFQLDVTAASGTTPTLDVKLQTTEDGTNWCDFAAFGQATAVSRQVIRVVQTALPNTAQAACVDGTLAAATVYQGPLGRSMRIKHALPGGTTPSFTYTVRVWAQD